MAAAVRRLGFASLRMQSDVHHDAEGPARPGLVRVDAEQFLVGRMLFNECVTLSRNDSQIYLAGIDDAHFYPTDDIEKARSKSQAAHFPFCCLTRLRFTAKPPVLGSI
jgi:hypothetical protein